MIHEESRKAPFLRALIPLLAGVFISRHYPLPGPVLWVICLLFPVLFILFYLLCRLRGSPSLSLLFGIQFHALMIIAGMLLATERSRTGIPSCLYTASICQDAEEKENSFRLVLDRISIARDTLTVPLHGRAQVYVQKDARCRELVPGMKILARGPLSLIRSIDDNPDFDYVSYMAGKGVYYTAYLDSLSWMLLPDQGYAGLRILARNRRRSMMDFLSASAPSGHVREKAILNALLLGYRPDLDEGQKEQFARSGSMHILAVSGLHVGILYMVPALLIRRVRRYRLLRIMLVFLVMILLWMYAMLTGLSPSVTRAVAMCCIHAAASLANRRTGLLHVLSLTAFIMVMVRPSIVFEAGFQLSFAAVSGIILVYGRLSGVLRFPDWVRAKCWQMCSLSIAAQLGTAPLVIYYFHQYPNYALLSNLVVIPLATLILFSGALFFGLSWIPPVSGILSTILVFISRLLDEFTSFISRCPGACSENLSLSVFQVIILYGVIILLYLYMERRKAGILMGIQSLLIVLFLI
ncbi:MAG: ComEC family competence protein [Bacteroidales bacterium]|nr:ComEC family competence protein [Bacteroidales bacterium]